MRGPDTLSPDPAPMARSLSPWRRLHAALMPDYSPRATAVWWVGAVLGGVALAGSLLQVLLQGPLVMLQVAVGTVLAVVAGLFPLRLPGTRNSYAAGEIFIFLLLLMLGPAAAAVAAGCEGAVASLRTSKRWTSRLYGPGAAALAMLLAGTALQAALAALAARGVEGAAVLMAATMVCSALYFFVSGTLMYGVLQLKRGEPFFQPSVLISVFRWVGIAFAGSACLAALLYTVVLQQGPGALLVMVPLLALLLLALHLAFKQQEAAEQLREAAAGVAEREATLAAREAEAAARHLHELQVSERRFQGAFTHASIGMALLAFDGRMVQVNPALCQLLGHPAEALVGMQLQDLLHPDERSRVQRQLGLEAGIEFQGFADEMRCLRAGGDTLWLLLHCSFFTEPDAPDGQPGLILQAQDVTARRAAEGRLQHLAFHDPLTGLPNRRRLLECLSGALARSRADPRHAWAVLFLDFDRFKLVNDSLGHGAGDTLLCQLARRLQEKLRPSDTVARLGGDEFVVLAERIEHERDAVVLAERLLASLAEPFEVEGQSITASASVGITFSAFDYARAEDVLRDADTAMYKAKSAGKARYAVFDSSLHAAVSRRLRLEGELREAVAREQLVVVYQPLFRLGAQAAPGEPATAAPGTALSGFEALVRWRHPGGELMPPTAFLPIAEEAGLMLQVTDFVLHCACLQLRQWQASAPGLQGLTMSVNLSSADLAHPALAARVSRALVEAGVRPEHLTLEITEDILMSDIGGALQTLQALRGLGVRLAVDDFGTGYSSLSHLSRLPIDSLKIDRSFVQQLRRDSDEAAVVAAILQLGRTLRKQVVAEGIETAEQVAQLRELGCTLGQGFHLAEPLSQQAAGDFLDARRSTLH
jgi:diguanylate cyclase (GGDEF)-like protein/PAS domain S-box-containing protein